MIGQQLAGNLVNGFVLGGVYGMATMGLSLIFGVLKIVNVGHGAFIMVGAFITLWMFSSLGMSPVFALPVALITGMALGFLIFSTVLRRLIKAPELASLLATFAIGMLLEEIAKNLFGTEFRGYNWETGKLVLPMTVLPMSKIYAFAGSVAITVLMYFWFKKTRAGTAVRSVVEDSDGAQVCGVNVSWVYALSFAIGIGLTVLSGVLLTMFIPVGINPYMGGSYTLKAFVVAVLGGLASPYGAFFAGLAFGLIENGSYTVFAALPGVEPFALTRFISFVMLLVILLIKPTGLLGAK
ncbi:MAG: branched-chain amino acid ABC transporter permease [Candidatus Methylomirabilota bacterium]|jgi:branched-chain amino acid transport system permease protein